MTNKEIEKLQKQLETKEGMLKALRKTIDILNDSIKREIGKNEKLTDERNELKKEIKKLQGEIGELKEQVGKLEEAIKGSEQKETLLEKQIEELKDENDKLRKELEKAINQGSQGNQGNEFLQQEIKELLESINRNREVTNYLQANNQKLNSEIVELKAKIVELQNQGQKPADLDEVKKEAISSVKKVMIEECSFTNEDIIPVYQGYAEKINSSSSKREIEDFVKEMTSYLYEQKQEDELWNETLRNAEDVSRSDRDKEKGIFEKRRKARQELDILVERTSVVAKQVYQRMNKNNGVINCDEKLYKQLENRLRSHEKSASEFLKTHDLEKYCEKGSKKYEIYCMLFGLSQEFSKVYLEGLEIDFYPFVEIEGTDGHTGWREDGEGFDFHIDLNRKHEETIFDTWAHEIMHDRVSLKERKNLLRKRQIHSKPFWEGLYDDKDSTFSYITSCLPSEMRKRLKILPNVLIDTKFTDARYAYFPDEAPKLEDKTRIKKTFKEEEVVEGWKVSRHEIFKLADDSMNENPDYWESDTERNKRWIRTEVVHKRKGNKNLHKIYIFYDKKTVSNDLKKKIKDAFGSWEEETITSSKVSRLCARLEGFGEHITCGCGKEKEVQQEAQIVVKSHFDK